MFENHVQKNYSDQHWYEIYYHLSILPKNFIWWLVNGMITSDCHHMKLSPSEKNSIYSLNSLMSPSENVTIWKNYSLSYQYKHITIWFVKKCILFISVTILVWNKTEVESVQLGNTYISDMDKCPKDKCCQDKCCGCNLLFMFPGPFV